MDNDGYYIFRVRYKGSYFTEEIRAVEVHYERHFVVFVDHVRDTIAAIQNSEVSTVRRVVPEPN